jgi:hypothetical protein
MIASQFLVLALAGLVLAVPAQLEARDTVSIPLLSIYHASAKKQHHKETIPFKFLRLLVSKPKPKLISTAGMEV